MGVLPAQWKDHATLRPLRTKVVDSSETISRYGSENVVPFVI
jgi:hypothetical protein